MINKNRFNMKTKYLFMILTAFTLVFAGCTQTDFEPLPQEELLENKPWETTYTFSQLISEYTTPLGIHADSTRQNSGNLGLYTVNIVPIAKSVIVTGRVISTDIEGNIYKSITIQEANTGMGLKISLDVSGSAAVFPIGQLIHVKCNGLAIGKYADMYQLGSDYYNVSYSRTDNVSIDYLKTGYEIGRISYPVFAIKSQMIGLPEPTKIKVDTVTINQLLSSTDRYYQSRIVCIKHAYFTGYDGDGNALTGNDLIFAPSTLGFGYPQSREIKDGTGSISISTSEYAKFAKQPIPETSYSGSITAIVGWYRDKASNSGDIQLTIRGLNDLGKGFEGYLNKINYK